jgi:hypothetical protein
VAVAHAPSKLAITERESGFGDLRQLVVRSRNFLKASGASQAVAEDAETFVRKLVAASKKPKPNHLSGEATVRCRNAGSTFIVADEPLTTRPATSVRTSRS